MSALHADTISTAPTTDGIASALPIAVAEVRT